MLSKGFKNLQEFQEDQMRAADDFDDKRSDSQKRMDKAEAEAKDEGPIERGSNVAGPRKQSNKAATHKAGYKHVR